MSIDHYLKHRKLVAGVVLMVALLALGLWPKAVPVDVAALTRGPMRVTVDHEGKTRIHDRYVVSAPVSGRLLRIGLEPGDEVRKGETLLATFKPADPSLLDARSRAEAQARVAAAQSAVGQAQASALGARAASDLARAEAARQRELSRQGVTSQEALEAAEATARTAGEALRAAEFAVEAAGHELDLAKVQLVEQGRRAGAPTVEIRSPIDGIVLTRVQQSEAVFPAGTPLLELGAAGDLEIVADFLSTDAVKIREGAAAIVEQWGGGQPLAGRVRRVEPAGFLKISALGVEEQRVNVIVDFTGSIADRKPLGDAYRVEVRVVIWEEPDVLKVPISSLFRQGASWMVFLVEGGRARLRRLEIGHQNGVDAEVVSGADAGRRVVIHPGDTLVDGVRVSFPGE